MAAHLILRTSANPTAGELRHFADLAQQLGVPSDQPLTAMSNASQGLEVVVPHPEDLMRRGGGH